MKEKKLTDKKIIDTLIKKSFIEIEPICAECATDIIYMLTEVFTSIHVDMFQITDNNIFCLRISL